MFNNFSFNVDLFNVATFNPQGGGSGPITGVVEIIDNDGAFILDNDGVQIIDNV